MVGRFSLLDEKSGRRVHTRHAANYYSVVNYSAGPRSRTWKLVDQGQVRPERREGHGRFSLFPKEVSAVLMSRMRLFSCLEGA